MRLRPEHELRAIWRSVTRHCFRDGGFIWGDPRSGDSVSDAEQLLCVLAPATELPALIVDRPVSTDRETLDALRLLGPAAEVPMRLAWAMHEYLTRWRDEHGDPVFSGGRYLPAAPGLDTVTGYAVSLRLCLAAIGFCKVLHSTHPDDELPRIGQLASVRLTAAMIGLLRCFTLYVYDEDSPQGRRLRALICQDGRAESAVLAELARELLEVRVGVADAMVGIVDGSADIAGTSRMFELGWTWGVTTGAPRVETLPSLDGQPVGIAEGRPDLELTLIAVEAIGELFSQRTRLLALLDDEQQRLSRALQLRFDLTTAYWARLATFGEHRWPLERGPWTATDGTTGDHHTVAVAGLTATNLGLRRGSQDVRLGYLLRVCADIARRQGIVRPPLADPPLARPQPGSGLVPAPSPVRDGLTRRVGDVLPSLFAVVLYAAGLTENGPLRRQYEDLADVLWEHVAPADDPAPHWHDRLRVVDGLVRAANVAAGGTVPAAMPLALVHQMLADADELSESIAARSAADPAVPHAPARQEPDGWRPLQARLARARRLADRQPGTAVALLTRVLVELADLADDPPPDASTGSDTQSEP
jgi:hypothetical protein